MDEGPGVSVGWTVSDDGASSSMVFESGSTGSMESSILSIGLAGGEMSGFPLVVPSAIVVAGPVGPA